MYLYNCIYLMELYKKTRKLQKSVDSRYFYMIELNINFKEKDFEMNNVFAYYYEREEEMKPSVSFAFVRSCKYRKSNS